MVDGGEKLCDYAINQWSSGKYELPYAATQENIARWYSIKSRISTLGLELKALLDDEK